MTKILIDKNRCEGCMICKRICPWIFEMDENGKAEAINDEELTEMEIEEVKFAIIECPMNAIKIINN